MDKDPLVEFNSQINLRPNSNKDNQFTNLSFIINEMQFT